jgi:multicomponent Na+:H+ antiporter subunit G
MTLALQVIGTLALIAGSTFSILGILGMLRLPDSYTRLHATGKISAFGCVFLSIAAITLTPLTLGKGLVLILLLLLSAPTVSHAIASAAYRAGVPRLPTETDELRQRLPPDSQDAGVPLEETG